MIKNQLVDVWQDPITRTRLEEHNARVTKIIGPCGYTDAAGHDLVRCNVVFPGESKAYPRDVSDV